jgi:hypothetical protein
LTGVTLELVADQGENSLGIFGHERRQRVTTFLTFYESAGSAPPLLLRTESLMFSKADQQEFGEVSPS